MTDDTRPVWPYTEMTEEDFRKILRFGGILQVTARMAMTGVDTSREWLEVWSRDGRSMILPQNWDKVLQFSGRWSNPGLFRFTYVGQRMTATCAELDGWEAKNTRDRRDYERLKRKFEGQPPHPAGRGGIDPETTE